ncbi:caspase domain-containing protein [Streptomyces sp. NPDC014746]|uniref:caspase family protein n=1 Tax=Streptomyces sp. NPDC014746 TaxID=3364904 RepID=UPI0037003B49
MLSRLPDPKRSTALLVGSGTYRLGRLATRQIPATTRNLADLATALTDPVNGGFARERCVIIQDPSEHTILTTLVRLLEDATDTFLFYYCGHGLPGRRATELFLGLSDTDMDAPLWWKTALNYNDVRRVLLDHCVAANRISIIDSCFSGRSLRETASADISAALEIKGTYTLSAVGDNELAYAPENGRYTAFTGELLTLLNDGLPDGPELLSMENLHRTLAARLTSVDVTGPQQGNTGTTGALALARNPTPREGTPEETLRSPDPPPTPQTQDTTPRRRGGYTKQRIATTIQALDPSKIRAEMASQLTPKVIARVVDVFGTDEDEEIIAVGVQWPERGLTDRLLGWNRKENAMPGLNFAFTTLGLRCHGKLYPYHHVSRFTVHFEPGNQRTVPVFTTGRVYSRTEGTPPACYLKDQDGNTLFHVQFWERWSELIAAIESM